MCLLFMRSTNTPIDSTLTQGIKVSVECKQRNNVSVSSSYGQSANR
jgi:hypothetical protein